jgi:hypothetical protein
MHTGSCLCGAITFEIEGELGAVEGCHCVQCRKWTGHFLAGTEVDRSALTISGKRHLKWFHSSDKARRGFCSECGSVLFFDPLDREKHHWTGVSMGAFDKPTGVEMALHIFVAEKGDYYEICDGVPQNPY